MTTQELLRRLNNLTIDEVTVENLESIEVYTFKCNNKKIHWSFNKIHNLQPNTQETQTVIDITLRRFNP